MVTEILKGITVKHLTITELREKLLMWYVEYGTWEAVAADKYNNMVSKALLWKIAKRGHVPTKNRVRDILFMDRMIRVPENMVRKNAPSATPDKRPRRAINLLDAASAAATIRNAGTTAEYRQRLAELLTDEIQDADG